MVQRTTPSSISAASITSALIDSVDAARASDADRFADALPALAALDQAQLTAVQSLVLRQLLERLHPDGLDADDLRQVLADTVRRAGWWPDLDPGTLGTVLVSSLGAAEPDQPASRPAGHGCLLIAELAGRQPEPLAALVRQALAEIHRAETIELP